MVHRAAGRRSVPGADHQEQLSEEMMKRGFGLTPAELDRDRRGRSQAVLQPQQVAVAAPPLIIKNTVPQTAPPAPPEVEEEPTIIPVSDPRHPQHEAWLLTKDDAPADGAGGKP